MTRMMAAAGAGVVSSFQMAAPATLLSSRGRLLLIGSKQVVAAGATARSLSVGKIHRLAEGPLSSGKLHGARVVRGSSFQSTRMVTKASLAPADNAEKTASEIPVEQQIQEKPEWAIKMLYDGDCPLCMREVNMLKTRDETYKRILFVDIAAPDYSPAQNADIDFESAMGKIHAILRDGKVIYNVEVFRRLYEEVGLGWVYAVTKFELIGNLAEAVYGLWAKFRMEITGRGSMEEVLALRRAKEAEFKGCAPSPSPTLKS